MEGFDDESTTVAIVCGTLSLVVLIVFVLFVWILWSKQRCGRVVWPWQHLPARNQGEEAGAGSNSNGSSSSSSSATAAGNAKPAASGTSQTTQSCMISVVVVHPGNQLDLGTADTPRAEAAAQAAAARDADGDAPIGLVISASQQVVPPAPSPRSSAGSSSRAAEAARAAYLAELEEREAARREMQRRSSGFYGPSPAGGWAMSLLPYIM